MANSATEQVTRERDIYRENVRRSGDRIPLIIPNGRTDLDIDIQRERPIDLAKYAIDIPIPKFIDCTQINPCEFIEKLEKYLRVKGIPEVNEPIVIETALEGPARVWYEAQDFRS